MAAAVALASPLRRILHVPYPRRAIPTPYHFFSRAAGGDAAVKGSVDRNAVEEVRNILDMLMQAERDSQRRDIFHTNFLTPPIIKEAILVIEKLADIKAVAQGGYPQAERCRISVGHPYSMTSNPDVVAALRFSQIFNINTTICYVHRNNKGESWRYTFAGALPSQLLICWMLWPRDFYTRKGGGSWCFIRPDSFACSRV